MKILNKKTGIINEILFELPNKDSKIDELKCKIIFNNKIPRTYKSDLTNTINLNALQILKEISNDNFEIFF